MKTMCKRILFLLFSIISIGCNNFESSKNTEKKYEEIIPNETVYSFINNVLLKENKIYQNCENLIDRKGFINRNGDSLIVAGLGEKFSQEDKEFIKEQYRNGNNFVLNKNLIKGKNIIKLDTTLNSKEKIQKNWEKMYDKYKCIGHIGIPLFNKAKNIVIVEIGYNCGFLCAERATFIYILNSKNKWELAGTFDHVVS